MPRKRTPSAKSLKDKPPAGRTVLSAAKCRRLAAKVAILQDEVAELEAGTCSISAARPYCHAVLEFAVKWLCELPAQVGPEVIGKTIPEILVAVSDAMHSTLTSLSEATPPLPRLSARVKVQRVRATASSSVTTTGIATRLLIELNDWQATRMELKRALAKGDLLQASAVRDELDERMSVARSHLLGLPTKTAPTLATAATVAEAEHILRRELGIALSELSCSWVSRAEVSRMLPWHRPEPRIRSEHHDTAAHCA